MEMALPLLGLYSGAAIFTLLFGLKKGPLIYVVGLIVVGISAMSMSTNMAMVIGYSVAFGWPILIAIVAFGLFSGHLIANKQYWIVCIPFALYGWGHYSTTTKAEREARELQAVTNFVESNLQLRILNRGRIKAQLSTSTTFNDESKGRYEFNISGPSPNTPIYVTVNVDRANGQNALELGCITSKYYGHRDAHQPCQTDVALPKLDPNDPDQQKILANAQHADNRCNWVDFDPRQHDIEVWVVERVNDGDFPGVGFQIDANDNEAVLIDLEVNRPGKRIGLILIDQSMPAIWNISRTKETSIAAILMSGESKSVFSGIDANIPTIFASTRVADACADFSLFPGNDFRDLTEKKSKSLFGRKPYKTIGTSKNVIHLGPEVRDKSKFIRDTENTPKSHRAPNTPLSGVAGLREAMAKGQIRPMTAADILEWNTKLAEFHVDSKALKKARSDKPRLDRGYVVLMPFTIPAGLFGANSANFILPEDVPVPNGVRTHSTVFDYRSMMPCSPPNCRKSP